MFKNQAEIIQAVIKVIPSPDQIQNLDLNRPDEIRFLWRSTVFKVNLNGHVDEVQGHMLCGTNSASLLRHLLICCK